MNEDEATVPDKTKLETWFDREDMEKLDWLRVATGNSIAGILRTAVRFMYRLYKKFGL